MAIGDIDMNSSDPHLVGFGSQRDRPVGAAAAEDDVAGRQHCLIGGGAIKSYGVRFGVAHRE